MKRFVLHILFLGLSLMVFGQSSDTDFQTELENLLESTLSEDETVDVEQLLDELEYIREHPLNINQANREDFQRLYFLSAFQINKLLQYRSQYGQIYSPYELNAIDGFDPALIKVLQEFVLFGEPKETTHRLRVRQSILLRGIRLIEQQKGFRDPAKYEGSPEKLYFRYRLSSSKIDAGITGEKDAGESFFNGANPNGFDYYSGFAEYRFTKQKNKLYLGDYLVQFGQGLTAWQGFSLAKSAEVEKVAKFNQGIRSYSSTDENNFMRGVATKITFGDFQWYTFISSKKFDANRDSVDGNLVFTSFQSSGLHRTESEIEDKNSVSGTTAGSYLTFSKGQFTFGLSGIHFQYELPLKRSETDYNRFLFEGKELTTVGADYRWGIDRYYFFGETAWSSTHGMATLNGLQANPVDQVELSLIYRNISKTFNTPIGSSFTEGSKVNDEQGFYLGALVHPAAKIGIRMYADFFQHNWITYTTVAPSKGQEYFLQLEYEPNRRLNGYARYFFEQKGVKTSGEFRKIDLEQIRKKLRIQLNCNWSESFFTKSRVEWSWYEHDHRSTGFLIFQDIGLKLPKLNSSWWFRFAWFNTDDYDSRIYAYENDLLYQFSVPALYGNGYRIYGNGKVKICENLELWMKASRSWFHGIDHIGSGYSELEGNHRTEVKFQLRFKF